MTIEPPVEPATVGLEDSEGEVRWRQRVEVAVEFMCTSPDDGVTPPFEVYKSLSEDRWTWTEYELDEDGTYGDGGETVTEVTDLEDALRRHIGGSEFLNDVTLKGPANSDFARWVAPLLAAQQRELVVNGEVFDALELDARHR